MFLSFRDFRCWFFFFFVSARAASSLRFGPFHLNPSENPISSRKCGAVTSSAAESSESLWWAKITAIFRGPIRHFPPSKLNNFPLGISIENSTRHERGP
ncbi:hypothetical protein BJX65DRAFT_289518 [Aspergillus insuetus]